METWFDLNFEEVQLGVNWSYPKVRNYLSIEIIKESVHITSFTSVVLVLLSLSNPSDPVVVTSKFFVKIFIQQIFIIQDNISMIKNMWWEIGFDPTRCVGVGGD